MYGVKEARLHTLQLILQASERTNARGQETLEAKLRKIRGPWKNARSVFRKEKSRNGFSPGVALGKAISQLDFSGFKFSLFTSIRYLVSDLRQCVYYSIQWPGTPSLLPYIRLWLGSPVLHGLFPSIFPIACHFIIYTQPYPEDGSPISLRKLPISN